VILIAVTGSNGLVALSLLELAGSDGKLRRIYGLAQSDSRASLSICCAGPIAGDQEVS